jgi:two-component system, OmpR family, sensor histidine kinase PhoQ
VSSSLGSIVGRLLLASAILLPLFLGATGVYLDRGHRISVEAAEAERLQLHILTLLAEAEYERGLSMPEQLLEARLNQPESGLYALVSDANASVVWQSPSTLTMDVADFSREFPTLVPGEQEFRRREALFQLSYQVLWEAESGLEVPLLFTVLEAAGPVVAEQVVYRQSLLLWLGGSALLLIGCQAIILLWGLRPLRDLARDIGQIEVGATETLSRAYPAEVQAVTDSLNTLLKSETQRRSRARNTLSDLAHNLKTPLAVIRSANAGEPYYGDLVEEQISLMEQIVDYQLQRAASGAHKLLRIVPVAPVLQRLQASLHKVYADKGVVIELQCGVGCVFRGDERDLLELMGIIMDNACKYGRQRVQVTATGSSSQPLLITVEDDGDGIPAPLRKAVLNRGTRADSSQSGYGIGLAVAANLADSYLGGLQIADSSLGGACLRLELP